MKKKFDQINSFQIERINLKQYIKLYKLNFIKYRSITQAPGYSIKDEEAIFLKISHKGTLVSIVSISVKRVFKNFLKFGRLSNGPLIIKTEKYFSKKLLLKSIYLFCKNIGLRLISIAPSLEIPEKTINEIFLTFKLKRIPWGSILLNLGKSEQELKKELKSNWRNKTKKGRKFCTIKQIFDLNQIKEILDEYQYFSNKLNFKPVSIAKCYEWSNNFLENNNLIKLKIFQAYARDNSNKPVGAIGIANFDKTAFYLFGYTNNLGRKYAANAYLLWHSIINSKENGFKNFDLGGYNSATLKGIKEFKEGVGGDLYKISGEFIHLELF